MSDDGHKYFFGQMPEMPWKQKEKEMDTLFKALVLESLVCIINLMILSLNGKNPTKAELDATRDTVTRVVEYVRKLG